MPCRLEDAEGPRPANHGQQSGIPPVPVAEVKKISPPEAGT
jgi:hypothetical protein